MHIKLLDFICKKIDHYICSVRFLKQFTFWSLFNLGRRSFAVIRRYFKVVKSIKFNDRRMSPLLARRIISFQSFGEYLLKIFLIIQKVFEVSVNSISSDGFQCSVKAQVLYYNRNIFQLICLVTGCCKLCRNCRKVSSLMIVKHRFCTINRNIFQLIWLGTGCCKLCRNRRKVSSRLIVTFKSLCGLASH